MSFANEPSIFQTARKPSVLVLRYNGAEFLWFSYVQSIVTVCRAIRQARIYIRWLCHVYFKYAKKYYTEKLDLLAWALKLVMFEREPERFSQKPNREYWTVENFRCSSLILPRRLFLSDGLLLIARILCLLVLYQINIIILKTHAITTLFNVSNVPYYLLFQNLKDIYFLSLYLHSKLMSMEEEED